MIYLLRLTFLSLALTGLSWGVVLLFGGEPPPGPVPLDVLLVLGLLILLPPRRWLTALTALLLTIGLVLLIARQAVWQILGRPLNLLLDAPLLKALEQLLRSNLGAPLAWLLILIVSVLALLLVWGLASQLGRLSCRRALQPVQWAMSGIALLGAIALGIGGWSMLGQEKSVKQAYAMPLANTLTNQTRLALKTLDQRRRFLAHLEKSGLSVAPLPGLAGKDVLLVFIESYGMSLYDDPASAERLEAVLRQMAPRLAGAGVETVSGRLRSPIRGGQSWLAHASVLSGITIDNDLDYRLLREHFSGSLVQDLAASGHQTLAVLPAITQPWPEGRVYGFDHLQVAKDIPYRGPALNWVTMPDQYTLTDFQRRLREPAEAPLFVHMALISSHAPWTPILPVLSWSAIDDGGVFDAWAQAGELPEALWRDMDRVREHYAQAVAYSLEVTLQWATRYLGEDALLMVMGDHPAAPLIVGEEASPDVPVHLFSQDPALLAPFHALGFQAGLTPRSGEDSSPMSAWRGILRDAFGRP
ncbi:alkaline phosphatase [Pistricoccus aurantiacus]|uniref:Alkaline phosphatase n=1 Tax=Pistricoccus aurantiacus TaxID=1883414 RepID=A0A5B8STV5_9GAMM|nr:alkaline phosphatase [Pistricoccus aurantiacus]QEA39367.1 alkaline phosphatase [Pistricoccus aurantiacus]